LGLLNLSPRRPSSIMCSKSVGGREKALPLLTRAS
jgi:hypothetical protein